MMYRVRAGFAGFFALLLCLVAAGEVHAQEGAQDEPFRELIERLGETQARIGFLQAHYDGAAGEDLDLFADQLSRRWAEHHAILRSLVEAIETAREAGRERPDVTELARIALNEEIGFVQRRIGELQERIADIRLALPDAPVGELAGLELELTDLNQSLDTLIEAGVEDVEMAAVVGLDLGPLAATVDTQLERRAALIAARIEKAADRKAALLARAARPAADSAAIQAELDALDEKLYGTTASLESTVGLLDRRGVETSEYRRLLAEATGGLGGEILDAEVVGGMLSDRWERLREWLEDNAPTILVRLLAVVAVLFVFGILARLGRRAVRKVLGSARIEASQLLKRLLIGLTSKVIWLIGFLVVLSVVGIDVGPALAGLGIAGFVLGFALQDTLGNFASGLMIMMYRPFDAGDVVTAAGVMGVVDEVTLVSTVIKTFDNQVMIVPNSKVWGDVINNVTAQDVRRVDLVFGIAYDDDAGKAREIMEGVLREHELVLDDPAPVVRLHKLGDSSVDFVCRPWCATSDYWSVYWDVTETVKRRFDEEGVTIPFPQRDVHVYGGALAEAGGEARPGA